MSRGESCDSCRFSAPLLSSYYPSWLKSLRRCRRHAPKPSGEFPYVLRDAWCGEYFQRQGEDAPQVTSEGRR